MLEFKSYYTGSSGNLFSISDGKTTLMLECGVPWSKIKEAFDYKTSSVSGCLITHGHVSDHAKAVKKVAKAGIDVYLSQGTIEELKVSGHRYNIVKARKRFQVGTFSILPFEAIHDTLEPLGFLICSGSDRFLFITDSAYVKYRFKGLTGIAIAIDFDLEQLKENVDMGHLHPSLAKRIIHNHMSLQTAVEFFKANDMVQVQEIHILHLSRLNSNPEHFREVIQATTGRPTYLQGD